MSLSVVVGKSQRQTYAAPLTLDRQNLGLNSHRYEAPDFGRQLDHIWNQ